MLRHFLWLDSLDLQNVHQDFVWHKAQGGHHDLKAWRRNEILRYKLIQDFLWISSPPKTVMEWLNEWIPFGTRLHHHHQVATKNPCFFSKSRSGGWTKLGARWHGERMCTFEYIRKWFTVYMLPIPTSETSHPFAMLFGGDHYIFQMLWVIKLIYHHTCISEGTDKQKPVCAGRSILFVQFKCKKANGMAVLPMFKWVHFAASCPASTMARRYGNMCGLVQAFGRYLNIKWDSHSCKRSHLPNQLLTHWHLPCLHQGQLNLQCPMI